MMLHLLVCPASCIQPCLVHACSYPLQSEGSTLTPSHTLYWRACMLSWLLCRRMLALQVLVLAVPFSCLKRPLSIPCSTSRDWLGSLQVGCEMTVHHLGC
jgi:hypothetical protein